MTPASNILQKLRDGGRDGLTMCGAVINLRQQARGERKMNAAEGGLPSPQTHGRVIKAGMVEPSRCFAAVRVLFPASLCIV